VREKDEGATKDLPGLKNSFRPDELAGEKGKEGEGGDKSRGGRRKEGFSVRATHLDIPELQGGTKSKVKE